MSTTYIPFIRRLSPLLASLILLTSFQEGLCQIQGEGEVAGDRREIGGIAFRWCPSGTFRMGNSNEKSDVNDVDHVSVTLSKGFWLAETELTQRQWQQVMGSSPWRGQKSFKEGEDYPATFVSYMDAVSYCQKLTNQERSAGRLPAGWKYSLPTEAQWEYGCRAGTTGKFSFGDDESQLGNYGWFDKNSADLGEKYAHMVAQKKSNPWGLFDMHGNVEEWCLDWFEKKLPGGSNPQGPSSGSNRVHRGGSWISLHTICQSAFRDGSSPADEGKGGDLGFRLAVVRE